jgi:hypothetical protein
MYSPTDAATNCSLAFSQFPCTEAHLKIKTLHKATFFAGIKLVNHPHVVIPQPYTLIPF